MNSPLKRFLISLSIPPLVGTLTFGSIMAVANSGHATVSEYLAGFLFIYVYAFIVCFIPGSLFYLAHEALARMGHGRIDNKPRYIIVGCGLGAIAGALIGSFVGIAALKLFVPVGIFAGLITSWLNHTAAQQLQAE